MRISKSLFVLPLIIASLSATSGARGNHCDHNDGKTGGAIGGAVIGGILGAVIDHRNGGAIALGAGSGAVVGGLIGHGADDQKNFDECGTDSASYQRHTARDQARYDDRAERDARVENEISYDREDSRRRWNPTRPPRPYPRHDPRPYPRPDPSPYPRPGYRNDGPYQCQDLGNGLAVVYRPLNRVIEYWGADLNGCYASADYRSYGY